MSKFLRGTFILLIATLITRILGFINRIVIARFIGEEGVGLYMMALPTLFLVITITQLGLPVAISKFVAEADARGDDKKVKKILVVALTCTFGLSLIFTPAMLLLAPMLAETLFTDDRTIWPLMAIAPIVPIVAISSVLRGYFQGRQNMKPYALSQVIEQIARITFIAVLTKAFLPYGIEYAAMGAMFASVIGELVSLVYLMTTFKLKKHFRVRKNFFSMAKSSKGTFIELMGIGLPTTGSRLIGNISWFFEPIVVAQSLAIAGVSTAIATRQYGELTGYALPLLMLPSFVTTSLATSLVPAVSEAKSLGDYSLIERRLQQTLRITFITGSLAMVILFVLAEPVLEVMYHSSNAAIFIKFLAPFFILFYCQLPLQSMLQALNLAKAAMINSFIGAVVKIVIIWLLASKESFGIMGAAIGIASGTILVTFLHFSTILKVIPFTLKIRTYLSPIAIAVIAGGSGHYAYYSLFSSLAPLSQLLLSATVISAVFLAISLLTGVIRKAEIKRIPYIGMFLSKFAFR
ncbi:stage V sporulation protein B [Peribacillus cavernae]|uniref:Stage V sporulation protein B n=1 Tax=Peribacillus cavernae TaxID=1674310 RepID=A0A433HH92_9BACI|nr:stage V sporulation protein B [Peribacillus cavernae]MDQ0219337.1 stage V sporulation protein B [Peribacillus cavernae]RUQ27784.1 stage V sporulation protein B [Peribacillus cavernae]